MAMTFHESTYRSTGRTHRRFQTPQALIVDDEVESIQPLQIVLTNLGFDITVAFDGNEALKAISRRNFDLIFLDVVMPHLSGPEVLQKFGELKPRVLKPSWTRSSLPIITYSSFSLDEITLPSGDGQFTLIDHWQKPILLPEIAEKISQLITLRGIELPHVPSRKEAS